MHGKYGLLSLGKASSHSTALPSALCCYVLPLYAVFSCFYTTRCDDYSFTTGGYGIFNMRANVGASRKHEGGSGINKCAQEVTRRDRKNVSHPAPPGDRTQALTTELRPVLFAKTKTKSFVRPPQTANIYIPRATHWIFLPLVPKKNQWTCC